MRNEKWRKAIQNSVDDIKKAMYYHGLMGRNKTDAAHELSYGDMKLELESLRCRIKYSNAQILGMQEKKLELNKEIAYKDNRFHQLLKANRRLYEKISALESAVPYDTMKMKFEIDKLRSERDVFKHACESCRPKEEFKVGDEAWVYFDGKIHLGTLESMLGGDRIIRLGKSMDEPRIVNNSDSIFRTKQELLNHLKNLE